jgi:hypothetical protein
MKLSKEDRANWNKEQRQWYKENGTLHPSLTTVVLPPKSNNHIITVLCVRFGNKYGREYVERLRNMISRHLTVSYEFVCLTDDLDPIEGVRTIYQPNAQYPKGWWHKVHMFDSTLPLKGRILFFDLDVKKIFDYHISNKMDLTIVTHPNNHPKDSDQLSFEVYQHLLLLNLSLMIC